MNSIRGNLLLISEIESDAAFVEGVAAACGVGFTRVQTVHELDEIVASEEPAGIFLATDSTTLLDSFVEEIGGRVDSRKIHAILAPESRGTAEDFIDFPDIGNLVVGTFRSQPDTIRTSSQHYARIVKSAASSVLGLAAFFDADGGITSKEIRESLQKRFIVDAFNAQLVKNGWSSRMASSVAAAVDELIMNAVFDAPVDEKGRQLYESTSRASGLVLPDHLTVDVHVGFESEYVGVTVIDKVGSLNRRKVLSHAFKGYAQSQEIERPSHLQGSGLGLALILRSGGSLCFSCKPGEKSEVTVFFGRTTESLQFRNQFQFIAMRFEA